MLWYSALFISAAAICLLQEEVKASVGASVFACSSLADAPSASFDAYSQAGAQSNCMNSLGHGATMEVSTSGITCTCIGYAEEKGSGLCWFDSSTWSLSYEVTGGNYAGGSTSTIWYTMLSQNECQVQSVSDNTVVCDSIEMEGGSKDDFASLLSMTEGDDMLSVKWPKGSTGPIYIIFQPSLIPEGEQASVKEA